MGVFILNTVYNARFTAAAVLRVHCIQSTLNDASRGQLRWVNVGRLQATTTTTSTTTKMKSSSSSLVLLTVLQLLAVVARSVNKSSPVHQHIEPAMTYNDVEGCYVVTIFGLKTADCGKRSARSVPTSLDSHLQVTLYYLPAGGRVLVIGSPHWKKLNVSGWDAFDHLTRTMLSIAW